MSPSPTPLPPLAQVDVTASRPSKCCGRLPYSVNNGPWRCGCGKDVPQVFAPYVPEEAFDALLSLVVENAKTYLSGARVHPTATDSPSVVLGYEHRIWAALGEWYAGGQTADEAREALKDVIRAALIEQTGGER